MDTQKILYAILLIVVNAFLISTFIDKSVILVNFSGVMIFYYLLIVGCGYLGSNYLNNEMMGSIAGMAASIYLWVTYGKKMATSS